MSDKAINHGKIHPTPKPVKRKPLIPSEHAAKLEFGLDHATAIAKYGWVKVRALKGTTCCGKIINEGDFFECAANDAVSMCASGQIEFLEVDFKLEQRLIEQAVAKDRIRARDWAELRQQQQERESGKSWMEPTPPVLTS